MALLTAAKASPCSCHATTEQVLHPALASRPRSILFLVDQLTELGGGERALFQLARALVALEYSVMIVTFRGNINPESFCLFDNILILDLQSCFSLRAVSVAWTLRTLMRQRHVDVVHTFFETADLFGTLVARAAGIRTIVSSRRDMGFLRQPKHRLAYRMLAPCFSRIIAVSHQVKTAHMLADHLPEAQVTVIQNGLDVHSYQPANNRLRTRDDFGLPNNVPLITTVANINTWKGLDLFIEAAASVLASSPRAAFAVAGDWTDLALLRTLKARAQQLGIEQRIHFLGRVEDVRPLLFASDVFVLLSRSEGFPNVVIEAMAASLPVVASAVGGTPEAVIDGETGILVENGDHAAAAQAITTLLDDPQLRRQMGVAGRARTEACFSLDALVRKHQEVYNALLA